MILRSLLMLLLALPAGADGNPPRVQWHATWKTAIAAAKATGRPIVFTTASPQCHYIPGVW